jgi:hypothetical protein
MNSTKDKELHPKTIESRWFQRLRVKIIHKEHMALTHDPLKEIRRKTLSNPRNQPKNKNTKEAPKRPTKITMPNLLYNKERFIQGLACLLNIHPSPKISP